MTTDKSVEPIAIILGIGSDIGAAIARSLVGDGWRVTGTYRTKTSVDAIDGGDGIELLPCDISSQRDVQQLADKLRRRGDAWTLFLSAVGRLDPIGRWDTLDYEAWERSVLDNSLHQLRALHAVLPLRRRGSAHAAFFAGGGTNGPFRNYSAYCLGKIALIKMCELLHDEVEDLNAFIVGPGFVPTKIHEPTLANPAAAEGNYSKTTTFYERREEALSPDDVYRCIRWCIEQGRDIVGGRNIAAAHDPWQEDEGALTVALRADPDAWRLRRSQPPRVSGGTE